jgi:hypothetical protein
VFCFMNLAWTNRRSLPRSCSAFNATSAIDSPSRAYHARNERGTDEKAF